MAAWVAMGSSTFVGTACCTNECPACSAPDLLPPNDAHLLVWPHTGALAGVDLHIVGRATNVCALRSSHHAWCRLGQRRLDVYPRQAAHRHRARPLGAPHTARAVIMQQGCQLGLSSAKAFVQPCVRAMDGGERQTSRAAGGCGSLGSWCLGRADLPAALLIFSHILTDGRACALEPARGSDFVCLQTTWRPQEPVPSLALALLSL